MLCHQHLLKNVGGAPCVRFLLIKFQVPHIRPSLHRKDGGWQRGHRGVHQLKIVYETQRFDVRVVDLHVEMKAQVNHSHGHTGKSASFRIPGIARGGPTVSWSKFRSSRRTCKICSCWSWDRNRSGHQHRPQRLPKLRFLPFRQHAHNFGLVWHWRPSFFFLRPLHSRS